MLIQKAIKWCRFGGVRLLTGKIFYQPIKLFKPILPRLIYHRIEFLCQLGYWPNFFHPSTFNEKLFHRKLFNQHPLSSTVADKWAVREFVAGKGLGDTLNEVIWVGNVPEEIPFDKFPSKYVVKATHASGWNIVVNDDNRKGQIEIIELCKTWLSRKYSEVLGESHYDDIQPQIIIEKYIDDCENTVPLDYKFFCFHGKVQYIQIDSERFQGHKRNLYDTDWNELPVKFAFPKGKSKVKPKILNQMIEVAEILSSEFDFCRIDLYCQDNDKIIFGEITMTPESGLGLFVPREWDSRVGECWKIVNYNNRV